MGDVVTFKANGRTANGYLAKPASGRDPASSSCRNGGAWSATLRIGAAVNFYGVHPAVKPDVSSR